MENDTDTLTEGLLKSRSTAEDAKDLKPTWSLFAGFSLSLNYVLPISMMM